MMNEIYLIIGHRGTGKTTWIQGLEKYFSKKNERILIFDSDQEIQKSHHQTIHQLFEKGEGYFRKIENEVVGGCIRKARSFEGKVFISLGAGYEGSVPSFCQVIHLKRLSDASGRFFFDRPRILTHLSSFNEYKNLYSERKLIYQKQRDFVFTRLDHFTSFEQWDEVFLGKEKLPFGNAILTLSDKFCPSSQEKLDFFFDQRLKWGIKYFELKDNEVSEKFLKKTLLKIPSHQLLLSFREKESLLFQNLLNQMKLKKCVLDWPVEWGEDPFKNHQKISKIYSLHERENKPFSEVLDQFPKKQNTHLKLAVEIFSFEELWQGHLWQKEDALNRSFHPRSHNGRWKWYRLLFGPRQPLYFIREDYEEGVLDQPVMAESVRCVQGISEKGFSCVLGDPVEHSATPYEQKSFFEKYDLPVVPILMKEEEVNNKNIKILENFGMKFSAITSPLKKNFYHLLSTKVHKNSKESLKISHFASEDRKRKLAVSSLNTLIWTQKGWVGWNTDIEGALAFKKCIYELGLNQIAVWGGGAVREVLDFIFSSYKNTDSAAFFEKPAFYSAQTGKLLKGVEEKPEVVIWAVGRSRMSSLPHQNWKPLYVFDLNYTEDSPGLEYALQTKAQYISGKLWFKAQAKTQRNLFEKLSVLSRLDQP